MNERTSRRDTKPLATGPFTYRRDRDGCDDTFDIVDHRGVVIASIPFWDEPDTDHAERAEAIARLFAATPDMLAALERFESAWRRWSEEMARHPQVPVNIEMVHVYHAVRAAIALAEAG
jgi:hypothetical protein